MINENYTFSKAYKDYPFQKKPLKELFHKTTSGELYVKKSNNTSTDNSVTYAAYCDVLKEVIDVYKELLIEDGVINVPFIGQIALKRFDRGDRKFIDWNKSKIESKRQGKKVLVYKDHSDVDNWMIKAVHYPKKHVLFTKKKLYNIRLARSYVDRYLLPRIREGGLSYIYRFEKIK